MIAVGDRLEISRRETTWELVVLELSERRGPAVQAQALYEESEQSKARRESIATEKRALALPARPAGSGRPSKRDRRRMEQALRKRLR